MKCPVEILDEDLDQLSLNQRNAEQHVETDFSEYAWMADELEEFDRQVEEELWEEFFIEACFEEMYEDEEDDCMLQSDGKTIGMEKLECLQAIQALQALQAQNQGLNPNAPEFVPRSYVSGEQFENDDYAQR